ncbi:hypothetical protein GCM10010295_22390 [Streptomyces intermedius]|uniref:Uncharacterized protein n=1 Tax=Streptomyces koyangensis TaxID=188770 RepID=A0A385DGA0_9ACTN|nr:hypothetical protein D0C37_24425 [Streptomyces koyangensis]PKR46723.1 hypothetical protein CWE27_01780 [Streptomyces sp. EAG2]
MWQPRTRERQAATPDPRVWRCGPEGGGAKVSAALRHIRNRRPALALADRRPSHPRTAAVVRYATPRAPV